jgi:hypothetical protein
MDWLGVPQNFADIPTAYISTNDGALSLEVTPNPAKSGIVTIDISGDQVPEALEVHDILGHVVATLTPAYNKSSTNRTFQWDTQGVTHGAYIVYPPNAKRTAAAVIFVE